MSAPQMTLGKARVVDPHLTTIARGYQNNDFVGGLLFPTVPVNLRAGKVTVFDKTDFKLFGTARAPGENTKRVRFGRDDFSYSLTQHALEGEVPIEHMQEAGSGPQIDEGEVATMKTQNIIALRKEQDQAETATNAANYPAANKIVLAGTSQWSDPASTPAEDISNAIEQIRSSVGKRPNTVVIGPSVFKALKTHPEVVERMKYLQIRALNVNLLAELWDVPAVAVGDAVKADDAGNLSDVWGKAVVVAFTQMASLRSMGVPTYGYNYQLNNYPVVEEAYYDNNAKSWYFPVTDECKAYIVGSEAGFLISSAVA